MRQVCPTCGAGGGAGLLGGGGGRGGGGGGRGHGQQLRGQDALVVQQQLSGRLDVSTRQSESSFGHVPVKAQVQQLKEAVRVRVE